jgi:hypothetical protein
MNSIQKLIGVFFFATLLQSCGFGYSITQNFTPLNESTPLTCETPPTNIDLLFEGEKVTFEYEKAGMIEVQGDQYANDKQMLDKLTALCKSKCCDAIINLRKSYTDRQSGLLFHNEYNQNYSAITYSGIAVRKKANTLVTETKNQ